MKYYLVAMSFLVFDVEIIFLWPYAPLLFQAGAGEGDLAVTKQFLLVEMVVFLGILLIGWAYAYRKGALEWV